MSNSIEAVDEKHVQQPYSTVAERRRIALREIDEAKFSWFHIRTCLIAGVGFLTDAYDIFAISIAASMLGIVYHQGGSLTPNQDLSVKVAAPVGTFCGQLLFGWMADKIGRKRMYGMELMIILIATLAQAISGNSPAVSIIGVITFWRFIMGVGIGGDYPLSATITSEFAAIRIRGRMMTAVFAMQGFGNLGAAIVGYVCVAAFKNQIIADDPTVFKHVDICWRILIGMGCVPGSVALYFRLTMPETPRYTMDIERNVKQASEDVEAVMATGTYPIEHGAAVETAAAPEMSWADFKAYNGKWVNGKVLFGCAWSWFALDVAFYGLGLNSSIVLGAIGYGGLAPTGSTTSFKAWKKLNDACLGNIIISIGGLVPGYWCTFALIDFVGRKKIQLMGFFMLTSIFIVLGFGYDALLGPTPGKTINAGSKAFIALYCFANFFFNFGPNTTTFVIPGEAFPTRYRSTSHGISAASGKLGAIVAQVGFARLKDIGGTNKFVKHILQIFALFMLTGLFSTLLVPETMGRSLEDISNEDQEHFVESSPATRDVAQLA